MSSHPSIKSYGSQGKTSKPIQMPRLLWLELNGTEFRRNPRKRKEVADALIRSYK